VNKNFIRAVALSLLASLGGGSANAVQPDEILKDPQLEARARDISSELRCLVCQNQSIDDSDAPLARDLRLLVRERLSAGDSDSAVVQFLVDRYGDFVLLRPRFNPETYVLWIAPLLIFLAGLFLVRRVVIGNTAETSPTPELTREERRKLAKVLEPGEGAKR
jgi:cytochrome c-type biogenesis protein CcmH